MYIVECYSKKMGLLLGETRIIHLKTLKGVLNRLHKGVKFNKKTDIINIFYAHDRYSNLNLVASFKVVDGIIKGGNIK